MTDLTLLDLSELRTGLERKEFNSREIVEAYLSRIQANSELNCYVKLCDQAALEQANRAEQISAERPLAGIPTGLKDLIVTDGIETTCCSRMLSGFVPPYDATVSANLKSAGCIVLGKLNMDEFAMGSSNENSARGNVKNPWNSECVPGGSSGGSAAATAKRLAPFTLGSDTGGSIRQPAAFCGVVGLKPTYGRVSRYGVVAFASSLDQIGPLTRSVRDCAIVTKVISGHDPNDSTSMPVDVPDFEAELGQEITGLRVGVPREYFVDGLDPEVKAAVDQAVKKFESLGAEIVDISLPHTDAAVSVYYILAPAEASSNLNRYDGIRYGHRSAEASDLKELYKLSRSEGFGPEVKRRILIGTYVLSAGYYDAYYKKAQQVRTLIKRDFEQVFAEKCDLIVAPTAPTTAFKAGEKTSNPLSMYLNDVFTIPVNLAGLPGLSMPCGFDSTGLPIGIQLIGPAWEESRILKAAYAYERETDWSAKLLELD